MRKRINSSLVFVNPLTTELYKHKYLVYYENEFVSYHGFQMAAYLTF
jgi:hypothetical protein